jgi:DNA-binding IclR family transcriptional regulator
MILKHELIFHQMNSIDALERYNIRVLDRAVQVLHCFVEQGSRLSIDEIAQATGLPKSTAYRILVTLQRHGLLARHAEDETFTLGAAAVLIGATAIRELDLPQRIRPHLEQLMEATGETAHLAILTQNHVIVVDKIDSPHPIRLVSSVGFRSPLHCTGVGKVLLAHLPAETVERLLHAYEWRRYTPNTITDPQHFAAELAKIRSQGYAVDWEEFNVGLRCVAAPLYDYTGAVVAAVSVSGPSSRIDADHVDGLAQTVLDHSRRMWLELGYRA